METKFGVWLKSKGFARLFPVIVVAAMGYLGLRIATALQWGVGLHCYLPVFVLMALMLLLVVYAPVVRAWLVLAAAGISTLLLIYGSVHARRLKTASYQVELGLPGGNRGYGSGARRWRTYCGMQIPGNPPSCWITTPQGIREAASCGVDLVLCGHTHKGQLFPLTILTRLANGAQYFYGYGVSEKTRSVISAGTGFFGLPIRIGTDSEIVVAALV